MEAVLPPGVDPSSVREKKGFGLRLGGPDVPMRDLFSLAGRTVIVTGGAGSIGAFIAHAILESGGDVICVDKAASPPTKQWEVLTSTANACSVRLQYESCDIGSPESIEAVFTATSKRARYPLRGLVACAGIALNVSALECDLKDSLEVFSVNINGTLASCQMAAKIMCAQSVQAASIVMIASMSAHGANKGIDTAAYNTSKAAILQLARSLASEWGFRNGVGQIRVNTVSPGYVKTALTAYDMMIPGREEQWSSENFLNRLSYPDEYRGAVIYLLSDASSFVTGADLRVDGGHTAW